MGQEGKMVDKNSAHRNSIGMHIKLWSISTLQKNRFATAPEYGPVPLPPGILPFEVRLQ